MGKKILGVKKVVAALIIAAMGVQTGSVVNAYADNGPLLIATREPVKEVEFQSAAYHYMNVGDLHDFNLVNKKLGTSYVWSSSNKKVATVTSIGVVLAHSAGTATISCKMTRGSETKVLKAEVKVVEKKPENRIPEKITIDNKVQMMSPSEQYSLNTVFFACR